MSDSPRFNLNHRERKFARRNAQAVQRVGSAIMRAKVKWMTEVMRMWLPPEQFRLAYTKKMEDKIALRNYLTASSIREVVYPNHVQLMRGEELLGVFQVDFKDGKVEIIAKVLPKKAVEG